MATMTPTNNAKLNGAIVTDVTVAGSNGGTGKSITNRMLSGTPSSLHSTNDDKKMTTLQGNTNRGSVATEAAKGAVTEVNKGKTGTEIIVTGTIGWDSNKSGVTKSPGEIKRNK